jgi:RNA polymerase sigma factor (sigma-70 family)
MTADKMYTEYQDLINKRAWSWHRTSGVPFEDLQAQGNLIFCEALECFDEDQSSFSTWLTLRLNQKLYIYIRYLIVRKQRETYFGLPDMLLEEDNEDDLEGIQFVSDDTYNPERTVIFSDTIDNLSDEAKQVVNIIFNSPAELTELLQASSRRGMVGVLKRHLKDIRRTKPIRWTWVTIEKTLRELRMTFN